MQGERTENIPDPAQNQMAFINFMLDPETQKKWMEKAAALIKKNEALLRTMGKASEIDKLHSDASELKAVVLAAIEARETALAADRKAFSSEMAGCITYILVP